MKKILFITDMDSTGSGYKHICVPLALGLAKLDYEIKIIGHQYHGEEHDYPFSVLPAMNIQECHGVAVNMMQLWQPDVVIVALDLPHQGQFLENLKRFFTRNGQVSTKYICITPLENGPLCLEWAAPLFNMDGVFFISELGKQEAIKVGISKAEHLQVGIDTVSWRPALPEEKKTLRDGLGIPQDAFVVLTVADNQERKNLWAGMRAIARTKKEITRPIKYVMVTREQNPFGFKLRDLAVSEGINAEYTPYERGLPTKDLWALYAVADVYLQPSKAEGLGLPVLDAMAMKIPVVATRTGAMTELLESGRGILVDGYEFDDEPFFVDVWGNSNRVMMNVKKAAKELIELSTGLYSTSMADSAYEYVSQRTWDIPVQQVHAKIEEITK